MKQIDHCKDCYFYRGGICKNELSYNCGKEPTQECYLWEPIFGVVRMIDISEAKSIIKSVKKALEELQTSGWTVEINNESRSIYLSSGEITIKARPTKPIILEAREGYKGYC